VQRYCFSSRQESGDGKTGIRKQEDGRRESENCSQ